METCFSVPIWKSGGVAGPDGLWQASAQGRVSKGAIEFCNKAAMWSPSTKTFELDLLEVRRLIPHEAKCHKDGDMEGKPVDVLRRDFRCSSSASFAR